MSKVSEITHKDFEKEVLKSDKPVLVDFWAPWCGPCKMMSPVLDELAEELGEKIKVIKINVDEEKNDKLVNQYEVQGVPNLRIFKSGKEIKQFVGFMPKQDLKQKIEELL